MRWSLHTASRGSVRTRFAVDDAKFQRVEIAAAVDNVASRRVAVCAGAALECVTRDRLLLHGGPIAAAVHSLVPGDLDGIEPDGSAR